MQKMLRIIRIESKEGDKEIVIGEMIEAQDVTTEATMISMVVATTIMEVTVAIITETGETVAEKKDLTALKLNFHPFKSQCIPARISRCTNSKSSTSKVSTRLIMIIAWSISDSKNKHSTKITGMILGSLRNMILARLINSGLISNRSVNTRVSSSKRSSKICRASILLLD